MQKIESRGLVLFNRNYRENDKLVKILPSKLVNGCFLLEVVGQVN